MRPGIISEWDYEDYIDRAYGRGADLRETKIWKDSYERGFVCPDGNGDWLAFAYDGKRHRFLGTYGFDDVFGEDTNGEEEDWYDYRERMYAMADRTTSADAIGILRNLYTDPRNTGKTAAGMRIANDSECLQLMADYWSYVRWNEHGNECSLSEIGFEGFVTDILDPGYALNYLMPEGPENAGDREKELAGRLKALHWKYVR